MASKKASKTSAQSSWQRLKSWLEDYGPAVLVLMAIAGAGLIALPEEVPSPVPDYTLQSKSLYRVLVGGVAFGVFAFVIGVLVMALNGWVITDVGPRGIKGARVVKSNREQQVPIKRHEDAIKGLKRGIERNKDATSYVQGQTDGHGEEIRRLTERLSEVEDRLAKAEARLSGDGDFRV